MNWKIISAVVIVIIALGAIGFFVVKGMGHTDETEWGYWYQEYTVYYEDGSSSPLSVEHEDSAVAYLEYVLKVDVNEDYSTGPVTLNFDSFSLKAKSNGSVIDSVEFYGDSTITPSDGEETLFTKQIDLSGMENFDAGRYSVAFEPTGIIRLDGTETDLPSGASLFVTVQHGGGGDSDIIIDWSTDIVYN